MVRERYLDLIGSERELISITGLDSFQFLQLLEDIVIIVVPKANLHLCMKNLQLSIKDRFILTFMKLK